MTTVIIIILWLAIVFALCVGIVYQSAKNDRQFTFRATGEVKFKTSGEMIIGVIIDESRDSYNSEKDILYPGKPTEHSTLKKILLRLLPQKLIGKLFGIAYVSILYPLIRIHSWPFSWPKLEPKIGKGEDKEGVLESYIVVSKTAGDVKSLFIEYTYPIIVRDIELDGNLVITVYLNAILVVRRPVYLIGNLKGKFMAPLETNIAGLIDNAISRSTKDTAGNIRKMTDDEWRALNKEEFIDGVLKKGTKLLHGSFVIREVSYVSFDYSGNSKEIKDAIVAKKIAEKKKEADIVAADARVEVAKRDGEAIRITGDANADAIRSKYSAAASVPGGIETLQEEIQAYGLKEFRGSTLITGKAKRTMVSIPASEKPATEKSTTSDDKSDDSKKKKGES